MKELKMLRMQGNFSCIFAFQSNPIPCYYTPEEQTDEFNTGTHTPYSEPTPLG
jgi:hypothetical protein